MTWPAQQYDRFQQQYQYQYGLQLLAQLESNVVLDRKSVLDLGCGTGDLALLLKEKTGADGHVTAIDRDPAMISAFQGKAGSEDIKIVEADFVEWISNCDICYDVVVSNAAFHWIRTYEELDAVFRNSYRCLRSGGSFAFRFSLSRNGESAKRFLEKSLRDYLAQPELTLWRSIFEFETCQSLLEGNHLNVACAETISYSPFTQKDMNFHWMIDSQPIVNFLKDDELENFKSFLWSRWSENPVELECHHGQFVGRRD